MAAPSSAVTAGIQGLLVGVLALAFGYLVVSALSTVSRIRLDPLTRWSLSVIGLALVTVLLMVAHIASRGAVYSNSNVVRASVVCIVVACIVVRVKVRQPQAEDANRLRGSTWLVVLILATAAIAIWTLPIFRLLPLHFGGDTMQHLIRASELRAGNSTPATPLAAAVPNDYPYLFHAMLAFLSHFTPGGRASHAYAPMMVILAGGGALTFFGLGKELTEKIAGGFFLVLFGTLSGGIGFLVSRGPAAVSGPRNAEELTHYVGDFVWNRSYNFAFHNLAPPYPRDLSYALLGAFLLLLVIGVRRRSLPILFAAGMATGLLGLTGGEAFFVALGISCVAALWVVVHRPVLSGLVLLLPAQILYALWAVPMLVNYLKFGGFANLSSSPVSVPALSILGAWGVMTPFAFIGAPIAVLHLKKDPISRLIAIAVAIPVAFVLLTSVGGEWLPPGLSTLGRPHRYWPLVSLGVALLACVGATWVVTRYRRSGPLVPAIVTLVAAALALASPVLGSIGYIQQTSPDPILQMKALANALRRYVNLNLSDRAAALTYYSVLSLFPALLAVVALVGVLGQYPETTDKILEIVGQLGPASAVDTFRAPIESIVQNKGGAGALLGFGLLGALWSASGYVAAFMRASNEIYEAPRDRRLIRKLPVRIGLTIMMTLLLAAVAVALVLTGPLAEAIGSTFGLASAAVTIWSIAKWPVMILLAAVAFALLYFGAPNVRHETFRSVLPGGLLAVVIWIVATVGFALYVANFGSYNQTYGSLGAIIVALLWLYITNNAILFGATFNAELQRAHGGSDDDRPFVDLRDPKGKEIPQVQSSSAPQRTQADQIQLLTERYAESGTLALLAWMRADVAVAREDAFVIIEGPRAAT